MPVTEWKEPALSWNGTVSGRARLLKIQNDEFIPEFLRAMAGTNPAAYFQQHQIDSAFTPTKPLKLFQPLHGCYYLVTASLVCRQLGLPDKAINRADNESVFFVIRRLTKNGEEAWIQPGNQGYWQALSSNETLAVAADEERFPMHPVKIYPKPETPQSVLTDFIERELHYGYIPTGNRDKYKDTVGRTTPATTTPATLVNDFISEVEADPEAMNIDYNFRADLYRRRVTEPWLRLVAKTTMAAGAPTTIEEQWLYTLVELGVFLRDNLPTLWAALDNNNSTALSGKPKLLNIFNQLRDSLTVKKNGTSVSIRQALVDLKPFFNLVRGQGNPPNFTLNRDDGNPMTVAIINTLQQQVATALLEKEETQPLKLPDGPESELVRLISEQVQVQPTAEPRYYIRAVYEYDPDCPPLVSGAPSQPFTLAKFFEPEAPARLVRLEAPSIKPQDLRKFARGVGIQMSPELHKLASCLAGDDMDGVISSIENCDDDGISLQMICTFSIQIIFLVAFIVMFIFLISLNFIFWWLAYLRICLPIPKRT